MSKPALYILAVSANSHGALTLLKENKLDYDVKALDVMKGETRTPEFMAKNPFHCCPTIEDGDFNLWESNAILRYIACRDKLEAWYPADLKQRSKIDQFLDYRQSSYYPALGKATYAHLGFGSGDVQGEKDTTEKLELIVAHYLKAGKFIGDRDTPSIADLSFRPTLKFLKSIPTGFTVPKAIEEYCARFDKAVPSYAEVSAPLDGYLGYLAGKRAEKKEESKDEGLTLLYWNGRGSMEIARSLLATAGKYPGAGYEDLRKTSPTAEFPDLGKWNCGRMPLLKHNGTDIGQTGAINRYVARHVGMMGDSDVEAGVIDTVTQTTKELKEAFYKLLPYGNKQSDEEKKKNLDTWFDTAAPKGLEDRASRQFRWWLGNLEAVVGAEGFAVGKKASLVDAYIYNTLGEFDAAADTANATGAFGDKARVDKIVADFPKVAKIVATFGSSDGMKKWLETRGKQGF